MDRAPQSAGEPSLGDNPTVASAEPPAGAAVAEDWPAILTCLWEEFRFSSDDVGRMSRREVSWRLEMAAEKRKRRGGNVKATGAVESNPEFTEEESKRFTQELEIGKQLVKDRFKKSA